MVAGADGAQLRLGEAGELALGVELGIADLLEHRVLGPLLRGHTHAERDPARDLAHDSIDTAELVEVAGGQVDADCLVAAADVVADARWRDVALVGHSFLAFAGGELKSIIRASKKLVAFARQTVQRRP